jgi:hypothetical protein
MVTFAIFLHLVRVKFGIRVVWGMVRRYLHICDQHRVIHGLLPVVLLGPDKIWRDYLIDSGDVQLVVLIFWQVLHSFAILKYLISHDRTLVAKVRAVMLGNR